MCCKFVAVVCIFLLFLSFAAHLFVVLCYLFEVLFSFICRMFFFYVLSLARRVLSWQGRPQLVVYEKTMCSVAREKR